MPWIPWQPDAGQRLRYHQVSRVVTCCGLASRGMDFPATIAPFILRSVTLVGIDSVMAPKADRIDAWNRRPPIWMWQAGPHHPRDRAVSDAIDAAGQQADGRHHSRPCRGGCESIEPPAGRFGAARLFDV